jgi:single-stranded DNA-specific DHH superfamily exonuclease
MEFLYNQKIKDDKNTVKAEEANIYKQRPPVETIKNRFKIITIETSNPRISMSGLIATKLMSDNTGKTLIVINKANGQTSIRGILAKYVSNKLEQAGFKAGGHPGYCGATCPEDRYDEFITVLRNL